MAVNRMLFKIILACTALVLTFVYFLDQRRILREKEIILKDMLMKEKLKLKRASEEFKKRKVLEINDNCSETGIPFRYNSPCMKSMLVYKLPHLEDINNIKPIVILPSNRTKVWMVIGLSTVMRNRKDYLSNSVASIIENIHKSDLDKCLIVVLITEIINREAYVNHVRKEFKNFFQDHISSGLLEVVIVPEKYYPQLDGVVPTFNDTKERAVWRTKQNLDYIFLMTYCLKRGTYYLQLEDDIAASPKFTQKIRNHPMFLSNNWFLLEFSKIGFIGKLFNKNSLERMIEFLSMFYDDKPCDWLLHHFLELNTGCTIIYNCKLKRNYSKPSLFQHVGIFSSLDGKIQKIKATDFRGNVILPIDKSLSNNPPAKVTTSLREVNKIDLQEVYDYRSISRNFIYWADNPDVGDELVIHFNEPLCLHSFSISSGSVSYTKDIFYNAQLQVQASSGGNFVVVDEVSGGSKITLEANLGSLFDSIKKVRVRFKGKSSYWLAIRKISVVTCEKASLTSTKY